jgi:hypothetical protein
VSVLEYSYQPSLNIDEVNRQVSALVDACKTALLDCASSQAVEEVSLKAEQNGEQAARRVAEISARVNETSSKVNLLATYDTAQGTISVSAALVNGIAQSNIVLSGDHIILDGDVTIGSGFYLSGDHITANTITSTQIATATITANEIAGNTITAAEIASGAITADELAANSVTAGKIQAGAITAEKLNVSELYGKVAKIGSFTIGASSLYYDGTDGTQINQYNITWNSGSYIHAGAAEINSTWYYGVLVNNNCITSGNVIANKVVSTGMATDSGTDVVVSASGFLRRKASSSTRRVKNSISYTLADNMDPRKLYNQPVVQFKYNKDYLSNKKNPRYDTPLIGFIAEDMDEIYPMACKYDEEGRPSGWDEHYIIPPMLALIQEQNKRIERLEALHGDN